MTQDTSLTITIADPSGAEAHACLTRYVEELQHRFDTGFDPAASVLANPEELTPPSGYFLIARLDGEAVACGALKVQGKGLGVPTRSNHVSGHAPWRKSAR